MTEKRLPIRIEPTCTVCYPHVKCRVNWKGQGYRLKQFADQEPSIVDEHCDIKVLADKVNTRKSEDMEDRTNPLLLGS